MKAAFIIFTQKFIKDTKFNPKYYHFKRYYKINFHFLKIFWNILMSSQNRQSASITENLKSLYYSEFEIFKANTHIQTKGELFI